jgi:hypothetical protein
LGNGPDRRGGVRIKRDICVRHSILLDSKQKLHRLNLSLALANKGLTFVV